MRIVERGCGVGEAYRRSKTRRSGPTATAMQCSSGWTAMRAGATSMSFLLSASLSSSIVISAGTLKIFKLRVRVWRFTSPLQILGFLSLSLPLFLSLSSPFN